MTADVSAAITLPVGVEDPENWQYPHFRAHTAEKPDMNSIVALRGRSRGSLIAAVDRSWYYHETWRKRRRRPFRSRPGSVDE